MACLVLPANVFAATGHGANWSYESGAEGPKNWGNLSGQYATCKTGKTQSPINIAKTVTEFVPADIIVTESNDPRSYRLNSDKLLGTGFRPKYGVVTAIKDIIEAYESGEMKDEDRYYNIKTMKKLNNLII